MIASYSSVLLTSQYQVCGRAMKESAEWCKWDPFLLGNCISVASLFYGNMAAVDLWHEKTLAAWEDIDLPSSGDFTIWAVELAFCMDHNATSLLLLLGQHSKAASLLEAVGFTWDAQGFQRFDTFFALDQAIVAPTMDHKCESAGIRLRIFLASPAGAIDEAEVNEWIPSPAELAEMERGYPWFRRYGMYDVTSFGALAFLKLGRDDDAAELARLTVAPEQQTEKKTTLVTCHSILGQVAAKRGQMDEADSHFARALEEAKLSRLPMLEVLAARDWKKHALEASGRDCNEAESVIDAACAKMNKTREQIASVLSAE